jgi:hypothetical protein
MLLVAFPGGSSLAVETELRFSLIKWVLGKLPKKAGSKSWWESADQLGMFGYPPDTSTAIQTLFVELHRQFTGLGLITEARDVIYEPSYGQSQPTPKVQKIWRLTEKGEKYIALKHGTLRVGNKPRPAKKMAR